MGGICLRNLSRFNKALLAKHAMRIHSSPSLLVAKVFKAAYKSYPVENGVKGSVALRAS